MTGSHTNSILFLALLLSLTFTGQATLAQQPSTPVASAFSIDLQALPADTTAPAPSNPYLLRAAYTIDVYGGMAVGTLTQEFKNDAESSHRAVYSLATSGDVQCTLLEQDSGGLLRELSFEPVENETVQARTSRNRPTARRASDQGTQKSGRQSNSASGRDELLAQLYRQSEWDRDPAGSPLAVPGQFSAFRSDPFELRSGEQAIVRTGFQLPLTVEGRIFKLTLPLVRSAAQNRQPAGADSAQPVDSIPLRIVVTVHHAAPLLMAHSGSHQILADFAGDRTIVETVRSDVSGNDPFEFEFAINPEDEPTVAAFIRSDEDGRRTIETVLTPPAEIAEQEARPKQLLFIIDSSGSMKGENKLEQARRAVSSCVGELGPDDRFNIVEFDNDFHLLKPAPIELSEFEKQNLTQWLAQLTADGGTRLLPALEAMLLQPADPERHRMIVVVTDGIIQDEQAVLELLEEKLEEGRLFVVGTGTQVRQETLLRMAEYGRGAATFASDADSLETAVTELLDSIAQPLGWDVQLDWGGATAQELLPSRLPDLYSGRPVRVLAWFHDDLPSSLRLRMATMEGERFFDVKLPPQAQ